MRAHEHEMTREGQDEVPSRTPSADVPANDAARPDASRDFGAEVLTLDHVSRSYGDGDEVIHALHDTSLGVKAGSFVAVVGPSGSGKSTLLSIAGGLRTPSAGRVVLGGRPLSSAGERQRTRMRLTGIGFVLQGANLVPFLTVLEQFRLVDRILHHDGRDRALALLDGLGVAALAGKYPEELSGGERQRVAIARALYLEPPLILADEPTAALDSERAFDVVGILADEAHSHGRAVVMVTHDTRLLGSCDQVLTMRDGRILSGDEHIASGGRTGQRVGPNPA